MELLSNLFVFTCFCIGFRAILVGSLFFIIGKLNP